MRPVDPSLHYETRPAISRKVGRVCLTAERDDRARCRSERRIKAAGFPREKSLRTFDFDANPNIHAATMNTLASCEWIKKRQPLS